MGMTINKKIDHAPCLHCEDREPGCHGRCERYAKWVAPILKAREARYKELDANNYEKERLAKAKHKKRRRNNGKG